MTTDLLSNYPEFSKTIARCLFSEWRDIYIKNTPWKTEEELLKKYVIPNNKNIFVCLEKGSLVGFCTLNTLFLKLYLSDVYVLPKHRRKGCASRMIKHVIAYAKKNEWMHNKLYLFVKEDGPARLYEHNGFVFDGHVDRMGRKRMVLKYKESYALWILLAVVLAFFLL